MKISRDLVENFPRNQAQSIRQKVSIFWHPLFTTILKKIHSLFLLFRSVALFAFEYEVLQNIKIIVLASLPRTYSDGFDRCVKHQARAWSTCSSHQGVFVLAPPVSFAHLCWLAWLLLFILMFVYFYVCQLR